MKLLHEVSPRPRSIDPATAVHSNKGVLRVMYSLAELCQAAGRLP